MSGTAVQRWEHTFKFYDYTLIPLSAAPQRAATWLGDCLGLKELAKTVYSGEGLPGYTTGYMLQNKYGSVCFGTCFEYTGDPESLDFHFWIKPSTYRLAMRKTSESKKLLEVMALCCVYRGAAPAKHIIVRIPHERRLLIRLALRTLFIYSAEQPIGHCVFTKPLHAVPYGIMNPVVDRNFENKFFEGLRKISLMGKLDKVSTVM